VRIHCWLFLVWTLWAGGTALADPASDEPANREKPSAASLDDLLLDDLDNQLLEGLDVPAAESPPASAASSGLDRELLDQLGTGEDFGRESSDPFLTIGRQMRTAEELIGRRDASAGTRRVQQQIVDDLDRLIEQMNKQCAGGSSSSAGKPSPDPDKQGKPGSKAGSGENRGGSKPARDSETRVGQSDANDARLAQVMETLKQVWGHLPARVREQMQSGMAEEFLPKYERLIEQYYQRLAEDRATR